MTDAGGGSSRSSTGPLAVWLALQLGATALVALRVPLAAAYPQASERLAGYWILGTQVVAAGMLFPWLLRDARTAVQIIAGAVPFQIAAAVLSGTPAREFIPAAGAVHLWLLGLACWAVALQAPRAQMLGVTAANLMTLGAAGLHYLRLEYSDVGGTRAALQDALPLIATFRALSGEGNVSDFLLLAGILLTGLVAVGWNRQMRSRRAASPVNPAAGATSSRRESAG